MSDKVLWPMLDALMVELNKSIPQHNEKVRDGSIDHVKMDREKLAGEALGVARCLARLTGRTLDSIRTEAVERYINPKLKR